MLRLILFSCFLTFYSSFAQDTAAVNPLVITGESELEPYAFTDSAGNPAGYSVELISEILRDAGLEAEFTLSNWTKSVQDLAAGRSRVALDLYDTERLLNYFDMSLPIGHDTIGVFVRQGTAGQLSDLNGKDILLPKSMRHWSDRIKQHTPDSNIKIISSYKSSLAMLHGGKVDGVIAPVQVGKANLRKLAFTTITHLSVPGFNCTFRFAVRKGDRVLLKKLNDGILRYKVAETAAQADVVRKIKGGVSSRKFMTLVLMGIGVLLVNSVIVWFFVFRKRQETMKLLDENKASYSGVFNATSDTLIIFDTTGRIVEVNRRAQEVFGYKPSKLKDMSSKKLFHPGYHKTFEKFINIVRNGERFQEEVVAIHEDNTLIPMDMRGVDFIYNGDRHLLGIMRDITERKKVEVELRESKERAEAAAKAKSDFLANMSHEIRTPLNGVIGLTEILSETDLDDEQDEYVRDLGYSGEILRGIINDILDFSKIEAGKLELDNVDFNLYTMLDKLCCTFRYQAELNDVAVNFEYDTSLPKTVNGDPVRLRQVFTNLIGNAIKFTSHGSITVRVNAKIAAHDHVIYIFEVEDTGVGIPADKLSTLFDKFTQADMSTSRKFGGTGLGLTIAKQLVDKMDGTIYVKSQEGDGTTFSVTMKLPTVKEAHAIEDESVEIRWDRTPRILLAEDNLINQKVALRFLEELGCKVDVAMNGIAVLDSVKEEQYDLVFMDIQMPDMDGVAATKAIRNHEKQNKRTPIIALTAHALKSDHDQYTEAGMDSCLTKPISKNKMCITLIKVLSHLLRGVDSKTISNTRRRSARVRKKKTKVVDLVFDRDLALGLLGGDAEFLDYLLDMFEPQADRVFSELCSAVDLKDMRIAKHAAHSLKGIAAQIGAQRLEVASYDLEHAALADDLNEVKQLITVVDREHSAVLAAISNESESAEDAELPLFELTP